MLRGTIWSLALAMPLAIGVTAAGAAGPFDGTYRGNETTLRTNGSSDCSAMNHTDAVLVIRDGHFNRRWGEGTMSVNVRPDGTFHSEAAVQNSRHAHFAAIDGKITGGTLEADIGTNYCAAHLSLRKS